MGAAVVARATSQMRYFEAGPGLRGLCVLSALMFWL